MKVRVKFSKMGAMKFVGHLDMMRYFQKAVRRAGIDVAYSGGYSPHQIMSFAAPLGVGLTSDGEYFDMELRTPADAADVRKSLEQVMVEGVSILDVTVLSEHAGNAMASVAAAAYMVSFSEEVDIPIDWISHFTAFYHQPSIPYLKKTKKANRELDLKPLIYDLKIMEDRVYLLVNASSSGNIKPGFVLEAFWDSLGLTLPEFALKIHRIETYGNKGTVENPLFVPLADMV